MKKKLIYILTGFVFIVIAICTFLFLKNTKIERITCTSQFGPCSPGINSKLDDFQGKGISDSLKAINDLLNQEARVSEFSTRFILPNEINVNLIEKKGEIALGKQGIDNFVILDRDGKVIAIEKNTSLPIVNVNNGDEINFKIGSTVPDNLIFVLNVGRRIFAGYGVKLLTLYNDRIELSIKNQKIIFPLEGEIDVLLGSLNLILSRLNTGGGEIRIGEVDLRYKNPIIR